MIFFVKESELLFESELSERLEQLSSEYIVLDNDSDPIVTIDRTDDSVMLSKFSTRPTIRITFEHFIQEDNWTITYKNEEEYGHSKHGNKISFYDSEHIYPETYGEMELLADGVMLVDFMYNFKIEIDPLAKQVMFSFFYDE